MNGKPVAVITGASRGIGRAVATALAGEGFDIAAIARSVNSEGMEILGPEVEKRGCNSSRSGSTYHAPHVMRKLFRTYLKGMAA